MRRLALLAALLALAPSLPVLAQPDRPRLVVLLVVDQLRGDHLTRFREHFLPPREGGRPGGYRFLTDEGAWHRQCLYDTLPTYTAVGHAVVSTGGEPYVHGIIGNRWHDRETGATVTSVEDAGYPLVGAGPGEKRGTAPTRLASSTLGDELKLATNGRSRVFSVALKDRASILLGGRAADLALWFDSRTGRWVTSRWYAEALPAWVQEINDQGWPAKQFGWTWTKLLPDEAYATSRPERQPGASGYMGLGTAFPHRIDGGLEAPGPEFYEALTMSPLGTSMTLRLAAEVVRRERLGRGPAPDLLTLNLSSHDLVGHSFGPFSPEVQDATIREDRDLAEFFAMLDAEVGLDHVLFALTSDHGCAPLPDLAQRYRLPAGREDSDRVEAAVEQALKAKYGPRTWVTDYADPHLYLNLEGIPEDQRPAARKAAREAVRRSPAVFDAWTRDEILEGRLPDTEVAEAVARSFHRERAGDLFVVLKPFWIYAFAAPEGTTHGTCWSYDTQVPLVLRGPGVRPGQRHERCTPRDLAPTLCTLLGISFPAACSGRVLEEDL